MANQPESLDHMDTLLAQLSEIKVDKSKLPERLQEVPLETQLIKLANVSLDRETNSFEEIVSVAKGTK
jgi:hypothetical protein